MEYKDRSYPLFSVCGLNCGLCPRHHTEGKSKCPGCAGEGFLKVHPTCGVLSCAQRKDVEYCFLCEEYPCGKYDGADLSDSFITHKNQLRDLDKANAMGMDAYCYELNKKVETLKYLLENCDDGRHKSFYCVAVNLLDMEDIDAVLSQIADMLKTEKDIKARTSTAACLFDEIADGKGISLKLRKKSKS